MDCPAIPHELFESELFGVERGVATGVEPRVGRLEAAEGGTVLLDEIGDLSAAGQAKLLRFLQDRTVSRVGSRSSKPLDVRVLAATNRDLAADVERNAFRRDLYHRLAVVTIVLPPLRERLDDLHALCDHVLASAGDPRVQVRAHVWPGNVRELQAALQRGRLFALQRGVILPEDLPPQVRASRSPHAVGDAAGAALVSEAAGRALATRLAEGRASFWDDVWGPFTRRELPRRVVRDVVEEGLASAGGRLSALAKRWGMNEAREYRRFVDFLRNNGLREQDRDDA